LCPSLRICGQLPAPIVNGREDGVWKWKDFQLWRARDLDLGIQGQGHESKAWIESHCILTCITHQPLPICQISLRSK